MKTNFFFRTVLVIVLAMVTEVSMAQRVVNGIDKGWSTRQAGKYLVSNPSDTVILAVSEVIRDNGIRYVETRIGYVIEGKLVSRRDTVLYFEKMSNDISQENKKEYLRGEKNAYLPEHQRADKSNVHRVNVSLLGGANYIDGKVNPVFTGRLGYETCYFLFELEGSYSRAKYPTLNSYYNTFVAAGNLGWKFWQDRDYRSYIAVLGTAGYAMQKSDKDDAELFSKNYGFTFGAFLRGAWGFGKRFQLIGEAGYRVLPKVEHDGGTQEFDNGGPFVNLGVNMSF
jgi:hypothetical protein